MALATHQGGCHCGAVRYTVEIDVAAEAIVCNCSICGRGGAMMMFAPNDKFTLESGADQLQDYRFNKERINHLFCTTCGIKSFARGKNPAGEDMVMINARCLDDVDVFTQPTRRFDGRQL